MIHQGVDETWNPLLGPHLHIVQAFFSISKGDQELFGN